MSAQQYPPALPPGWVTQWDQASNRQIYVEVATGRTSWNPPVTPSPRQAQGVRPTHPAGRARMSVPVAAMGSTSPTTMGQPRAAPMQPRPAAAAAAAARRRAYPNAHAPANSVSFPSQHTAAPGTPPAQTAQPASPASTEGVARPPGAGHARFMSTSAVPSVRPAGRMPVRAPSRVVSGPAPGLLANAGAPRAVSGPGKLLTRTPPRRHVVSPSMPAVPPVPSLNAVAESTTITPADMLTPAAVPAPVPMPAPVPAPGVPDVTAQMAGMSMQAAQGAPALNPATASSFAPVGRMGNELLNAVVGAQPPNVAELDSAPPPKQLPPGSCLTESPTANADPSYQRCTLNAVPTTPSLLNKSKLPFGVVLSPMRSVKPEEEVPVVSDSVIARCRRCRTYINPYVTFTEGGHRWRCCVCNITNEVPQLFDWDQENNKPADRWKRPELSSSVVEFIAPREYMVRPPQAPVYVFLIDVSPHAVACGMVATAAKALLESLDSLPNVDKRTKVSIICYDARLHFFRIAPGSAEPDMLVVGDVNDIFLPQPNDLLVNLAESRAGLEALLTQLPHMFENNTMAGAALGAALQAANKLIATNGGKIEVLAASLPNFGPGALRMRDDPKLYGGARESTLLGAASPFYKSFPIDASRNQISVDMWLFAPAYTDVATLSCLPRYTGGQTFFYPAFNAARAEDAERFTREFKSVLASPISFEAVLRLRATRGIRATAFHGNFFVRSSDLLALPAVPRDQSYVIECEIEETLNQPFVVFQSVVLHSTAFGERRIRVVTLAVPTTTSLAEVYASADQEAIAAMLANKAVEKSVHSRLEDARGMLRTRLIDICTSYRSTMTNARGGNAAHLCLPHNLSLLPLLILGLLRHPSLRISTQLPSDIRAFAQTLLMTLPVQRLIPQLVPVLYSLHNMPATAGMVDPTTQIVMLPPRLNATSERFERHGLYLIDDGLSIYLWIGRAAVPQLTLDVFGAPNYGALASGKITLPTLDNSMNRRVNAIVTRIRESRRGPYWPTVVLVKEDGDPAYRMHALSLLVEDRFEQTSGYLQFLGQIRDKANSS
ncbi:COPII subunit [Malassezia cuniculi]|uniref:COPII subunit n=1 Tax=Malassezia cuniculi TaxID=948313 RepID=A0AAF0ETV5_9BASI|nr:COPII subunit [Malassezia cuniculi]